MKALTAIAGFVALLAFGHPPSAEGKGSFPVSFPFQGTVSLTSDGVPRVAVLPEKGEGGHAFAGRLTGSSAKWAPLSKLNHTRVTLEGESLLVPYEWLVPEGQRASMEALFPDDTSTQTGWAHTVQSPEVLGYTENLWSLARWFTGEGKNEALIRKANGIKGDTLHPGQTLTIPSALLLPAFRYSPPVAPIPMVTGPTPLEFHRDRKGEYALYRLQRGEALYTSVVIRFTGVLDAEDVNAKALEVARDSGITDVTNIPVGYPVKIRLDDLLPELLYPTHPRYIEWKKNEEATAQYTKHVSVTDLDGVHVILDAGHGGADPGARNGAVCEDEYVYDVVVRIRKELLRRKGVKVEMLVKDRKQGFDPQDKKTLSHDENEVLLTSPAYPLFSPGIGVNLRCFLSNFWFRHWTKEKRVDPEKIMFLSFHADSLHPSVNGTMIYYADTRYTRSKWGKSSQATYGKYDEVRKAGLTHTFPLHARQESEGISRSFAHYVVDQLRGKHFIIHANKPVRGVIKRKKSFVPAVLRYNQVPLKVLVEILNLNHRDDRKLIVSAKWRQAFAEAFVETLESYYANGKLLEARKR